MNDMDDLDNDPVFITSIREYIEVMLSAGVFTTERDMYVFKAGYWAGKMQK